MDGLEGFNKPQEGECNFVNFNMLEKLMREPEVTELEFILY